MRKKGKQRKRRNRLAERTEYAVFRFVGLSGYCHMVNDYVKGQTMMQYVKEARPVSKQRFWEWCAQLMHQMEQYYKWEDKRAYGGVNPYAVIVAEDGEIRLLDPDDFDNQEVVKRMQKKNVRVLFVKWEHVLLRKADREDDSYGLGKTLQFMAEKCRIEGGFTRKEERIVRRVIRQCLEGKAAEIRGLKELQREIRTLQERNMQGKGGDAPKDIKKYTGRTGRNKIIGKVVLFLIVILILAGSVVWRRRSEQVEASEKSREQRTDQKDGKDAQDPAEGTVETEAKGIGQTGEAKPWLELGLLYCEELEEYGRGILCLEKAAETSLLAEAYLKIETYIQKGGDASQVKRELEQALASGRGELESEEEKAWIAGKEYIYAMPFLEAYRIWDTEESWREISEMAEELKDAKSWGEGADAEEKEQNIREYLAKAYEVLHQPEKAAAEYERVKELERDASGLEALYLKLEDLYEEIGDAEKAWNICSESVERVPESEAVWVAYIERHLRDNGIERAVCAEAVKKAVMTLPALKQNTEFQKLVTEYGIRMEGEEVWIGE